MKLPNAHQLKELDAYTIQKKEITSLDLMESAAREVDLFIYGQIYKAGQPVIIFAGPGNNGGDGLAVARLLHNRGVKDIQVFLFNTHGKLSDDCQANAERLQNECPEVAFTEVTQQFEPPRINSNTLVIDALFGTGITKPLSGGFAMLAQFINASNCKVVSIDMPSGLMCEDNTFNSPSAIVKADYTLTIGLPKLSLILAGNQRYTGKVHVLPIELKEEVLDSMDISYQITEPHEIKALLKQRPAFGHKGTFGNALLVAGQYGMAGAAVLAAKACLKAGVGKINIHTPKCNNNILQIAVPEAVLNHDSDEHVFTSPEKPDNYQAIALGPGIGTDKRTALAFIEQVSHTATPLIIDADGINILGTHRGWISQIPQNTIFTPHPGEMQRLGICNSDSFSILIEAINMARTHNFYIVLKGHYTAICTPEGKAYFNPTGNSGMATAGSGDVLTGIILALSAQKYTAKNACLLGVYLHGIAGDLAAEDLGQHSVTASDIINYLPQAFKRLAELPDNPTNITNPYSL